jgi:ubiquinone/menaquinone biosynthesis C-methylase UbiE
MTEMPYNNDAASGYDRAFAHVSSHFVPFLLRAAHLASGQRVLDVATGTGLAAEAALTVVGPSGHVTATDISPAMVEQAQARVGAAPNASVAIEDGQALTMPEENFDVVLCSLGLMFFPDPARGLSEFHRVLRPGGWAAVSVNTVPERSFNTRISLAIGRHEPAFAAATSRIFSLGQGARLRELFVGAGFRDVEVAVKAQRFGVSSFNEYFAPYEHGADAVGQAFIALPEEVRHSVREDVRQSLGDTGGPIEIEVEFMFASGRK